MYTPSASEKFRSSFRKLLSRVCPRRCLRTLANPYALQLPDRDSFVPLPGHALASSGRDARCIFFRRAPHIQNEIDRRISGPAKLTRLLATCAASENLDARRGHVKRFVTCTQKKFAATRAPRGSRPLKHASVSGGYRFHLDHRRLSTARRSVDRCSACRPRAAAAAP
jgi:hypothetical protein